MKRFRDQLESEGLATKKVHGIVLRNDSCPFLHSQTRNASKRLSIEGSKASDPPEAPAKKARLSIPSSEGTPKVCLADEEPAPQANSAPVESTYIVQHIDITEEVNRRLQESRLRRLMDTPSTAQKRKRDDDEDTRMESSTETEAELRSGYDPSNDVPTSTKRQRIGGAFERVVERETIGDEGQDGMVNQFKRRKYSKVSR